MVYSHGTSELDGYHSQRTGTFEQVLDEMKAALDGKPTLAELRDLVAQWREALSAGTG